MSPLEIEVLLRAFYTAGGVAVSKNSPFPEKEAISRFLSSGAIECKAFGTGDIHEARYTLTRLGQAWVKAICSVPAPRVAYLDEHGREIVV